MDFGISYKRRAKDVLEEEGLRVDLIILWFNLIGRSIFKSELVQISHSYIDFSALAKLPICDRVAMLHLFEILYAA